MLTHVTPGFYRHSKGKLYRVLYEAKHTETNEDLVVYQAMYGKGEIWVRPKSMFLDEGRFEQIEDIEALKHVPIELNPKYCFPDLPYSKVMPPLTGKQELSKSVKSMVTLLTKKKIVKENFFAGLVSDDMLEKAALEKIEKYSEGKDTEEIFHLIQTWGGSAGRGIYVFGEGFDWKSISGKYHDLVGTCMSVKEINDKSIKMLVDAVDVFSSKVQHMGVAFITKHIRFWLYRNLGENTLPIYDSIMANYVMHRNYPDTRHLAEYWEVMTAKARQLGIGLMPLERQIFKYAYGILSD